MKLGLKYGRNSSGIPSSSLITSLSSWLKIVKSKILPTLITKAILPVSLFIIPTFLPSNGKSGISVQLLALQVTDLKEYQGGESLAFEAIDGDKDVI